jgi:hypothetical protein
MQRAIEGLSVVLLAGQKRFSRNAPSGGIRANQAVVIQTIRWQGKAEANRVEGNPILVLEAHAGRIAR